MIVLEILEAHGLEAQTTLDEMVCGLVVLAAVEQLLGVNCRDYLLLLGCPCIRMSSVDVLFLQEIFPGVLVLSLEVCDLNLLFDSVCQELVSFQVHRDATK